MVELVRVDNINETGDKQCDELGPLDQLKAGDVQETGYDQEAGDDQ